MRWVCSQGWANLLLLLLSLIKELSVFKYCTNCIGENTIKIVLCLCAALNIIEKVVLLNSFKPLGLWDDLCGFLRDWFVFSFQIWFCSNEDNWCIWSILEQFGYPFVQGILIWLFVNQWETDEEDISHGVAECSQSFVIILSGRIPKSLLRYFFTIWQAWWVSYLFQE